MLPSIPVYDITDWLSKPWFHTKGSREKLIVENDSNKEYYFKTSLKKENKHYPFEFWSEVIATQLGLMLEVPILNYEVAIKNETIGCMSQSMIEKDEQLIEGTQYLQAYKRDFDPEKKEGRSLYSFQLIEKALAHSGLSFFMKRIVEIIIFDAIIGNQDRHQENWGVIIKYTTTNALEVQSEDMSKDYKKRLLLLDKNSGYRPHETQEYKAYQDLSFKNQQNFAPIYDSGSSLGRELDNQSIERLLSSQNDFNAYLRRGKSEVRWESRQLGHIELMRKILNEADYPDTVSTLRVMLNNYSERNFRYILDIIDKDIPVTFAEFKIPSERKELIVRLVTTRVELLRALL